VQIPATGASGEKTDAAGKNSHAPAVTLAAPPASMSTPKDKSNAVVVSTRSSSEFGAQEKAETQGVNWLSDLIATDIPRSRVLAFQYSISPKPNQSTSWKEDIESTAKDLLSKVKNQRTNSTSEPPPIVFVGYGFGGIIIQKAIELAFKEKSEEASTEPLPDTSSPSEPKKPTNEPSQGKSVPFSVEMIRQVLFLDTPFPSVTDDKGKELFPPNNNVRMFSILQDIEKRDRGSKLVKKVWAGSEASMTDRFDINWLYSKKAKDKLSNINPSHLIQVCSL
jgi:hypothetical protein